MKEKSFGVIIRTVISISIILFAMAVLAIFSVADMYKKGLIDDAAVSAVAVQQLTDNGQAYQQIKEMNINKSVMWSIQSWTLSFAMLFGFLWCIYIGFKGYREYIDSEKE